jgi:AraC-like DNA-binding protein
MFLNRPTIKRPLGGTMNSLTKACNADVPRMLSVSTSELDPRFQLDAWEDAVVQLHGSLRFERKNGLGYLGRLRARQDANFQFVEFDGNAASSTRTAGHAASDAIHRFEIMVGVAGECLVQHCGNRALLTPGRILLVDMSKPHDMNYGEGVSIALIACNRALLEGRLPDVSSACGLLLPVENAIASVLHAYVMGVSQGVERLQDHQFRYTMAQMLDLVTLMLDGQTDLRGQANVTQLALLRRLKQHIHQHLLDDTLSIEDIARANSISSRYMQKLFRLEGTSPSDYLLEARLMRARALLKESPQRQSVASVAYASGFANASHFSTAYKRRFGYSPRDEWLQP